MFGANSLIQALAIGIMAINSDSCKKKIKKKMKVIVHLRGGKEAQYTLSGLFLIPVLSPPCRTLLKILHTVAELHGLLKKKVYC